MSNLPAPRVLLAAIVVSMLGVVVLSATPASATIFSFSTGSPDGRMGMASRPAGPGLIEIQSADDFILPLPTIINGATFTGLLPSGVPLSSISQVGVEIYRVFPLDSVNPPDGRVPTRTNSPSDNAFASRDSGSNLTFTSALLNGNFSAANSVVNGINPIPGQTTGGEGAASGEEVLFTATFTSPFNLPPDHYFFAPQVGLTSGNFFWLSTAGPPQFTGDLQTWIRNANLEPDWLRVGTDIVGGTPTPTFNGAFSLNGTVVPEPSTASLFASAMLFLAGIRGIGARSGRMKRVAQDLSLRKSRKGRALA